jgi:hypothetical protein
MSAFLQSFRHSAKVRHGVLWLVLGILGLLGYTGCILWLIANDTGGVALIILLCVALVWRADRVLR